MSNRVIKDSIWTSPTLNKKIGKLEHCLAVPWWILQSDDWGCFEADPEVIKGKVFPKRKEVTVSKVLEMRTAYEDSGLLFIWQEDDREWGYFVSFDSHHSYCNKTSVSDDGKQERHKRKTPEPPKQLLTEYLERTRAGQSEVRAAQNKYRIPNPNPNPNPKTPCANPSGFDTAWSEYPQQIGKKEARRHYNATVKNQEDHDRLMKAMGRYVEFVNAVNAQRNGDPRPWQNGSTWFNNWQEWLEFKPPPKPETEEDGRVRRIREMSEKIEKERAVNANA